MNKEITLVQHPPLQTPYKEYCKSCKRFHIVIHKPCPDCGAYYTPQPVSEKVYDKCHAKYWCDGCEAYSDHY